MSNSYIGEIRMFSGNFAPRNWALCNGQLVAISQNTALFSILGTTYGGNGTTTFGLPDLRGQFAVHPGTGPGLATYVLGEVSGAATVTLNSQTMPQHTHPLKASSAAPTTHFPSSSLPATLPRSAPAIYGAAPGGTTLSPSAVAPQGGNIPFANFQPYLAVSFIICQFGIFPTRN